MNKNIIIGVIVALLVGAGVWVAMSGDTAVAPATTEEHDVGTSQTIESNQVSQMNESFSGSGSFLQLIGMGRNITCDFSYVAEETNGAVAGTVKIAGENMRGDFQMQQAGEVYNSHMIQDDEHMYTWSETPQGTFAMKMVVVEDEADGSSVNADYERAVDMDSDVDYDCRSWSVDSSVFVPPSNIEFMEPETMMQNMMQGFNPSDYMQ